MVSVLLILSSVVAKFAGCGSFFACPSLSPTSTHSHAVLQVYTTRQWAIMVVQSYPYLPILETHLETMAADRGEPSKAKLLAIASGNYMAAEWRHLNKYLEVTASAKSHDYIPFSDGLVQPTFPMAGMPIGSAAAAPDLH